MTREDRGIKGQGYDAINSSQNNAVRAVAPTAKANHWSFRVRTTVPELLSQ